MIVILLVVIIAILLFGGIAVRNAVGKFLMWSLAAGIVLTGLGILRTVSVAHWIVAGFLALAVALIGGFAFRKSNMRINAEIDLELVEMFERKGMPPDEARAAAQALIESTKR